MLHRFIFRLFAVTALAIMATLPATAFALTPPAPILLSQGKAVVASSQEGPWAPASAVDGNTTTRWGSNFNNAEWIYVDLGAVKNISRVVLNWEAAYGRAYQIQVSDNASTWTTISSVTAGDGGIDDLTTSGTGRYVRMNGVTRATGYGYSLWEFQVYGTDVVTAALISTGVPAFASSQEGGNAPANSVDNNPNTRWGSNFNDAEWIYLDLGSSSNISRVVLNWEAAYGRAYQVQVSQNATTWTTLYSTTTGDGGIDDLNVAGNGRYVRMSGSVRGTGYGYSLWEFQVYGVRGIVSSVGSSSSSSKPSSSSVVTTSSSSKPVLSSSSSSSIAACKSFPNIPTNLRATAITSNSADIAWDASPAIPNCTITGYRILKNNVNLQSASGTTASVVGLSPSTSYSFMVVAINEFGESPPCVAVNITTLANLASSSSKVSSSAMTVPSSSSRAPLSSFSSSSSSSKPCVEVAPPTPTELVATGVTSTGVTVSWRATGISCPVTTGYRVFRDGVLVGSPASPGVTSLSITGLTASTRYLFTVEAFNIFGTSAKSAALPVTTLAKPGDPDFGPNVLIFDPSMPVADVQAKVNAVFAVQENNQFGTPRTALMFKPGVYDIDVPVGFFTHVMGLGAFPDQVRISSVRSEAVLPNNNATQNFWRGVENFSVSPAGGMRWGVSQAVPFRRMHVINNNITLSTNFGWASGGWMADSVVDRDVTAWAQQQWVSRNSQWGSWSGALWNMVFIGIPNNLPGGTWPETANTVINTTPIVREKPFVYLNGSSYEVFVPSLRFNTSGISWANNQQAGTSLPMDMFYIARSDVDTAASINAALSQGKHLLLTPGIYRLADPIQVTRANTIVLGMGFATLQPVTGKKAITVADVDGVILAHLMVDADTNNSPVLVEIGQSGSNASHTSNPTSVSDVFVRVGGNGAGKATVAMQINSSDVIIDHTWLWRADHGEGAGWNTNTSLNGLIVNGNNVTAYGLFVEHFQEYQVLWNGNNGRTYFYQSEIPYDPPTQSVYTSGPGVNGWASYKVADTVTHHEAWGLGVYAVFTSPNVFLSRAIEVPNTPNVKFHHMVTVNLTANGAIQNVINNTGGSTSPGVATNTPRVNDYPAQ